MKTYLRSDKHYDCVWNELKNEKKRILKNKCIEKKGIRVFSGYSFAGIQQSWRWSGLGTLRFVSSEVFDFSKWNYLFVELE